MSSKTKAYVLPRDAILDSQPSRVVRNIGYMLELGTGVDEDYRIPDLSAVDILPSTTHTI